MVFPESPEPPCRFRHADAGSEQARARGARLIRAGALIETDQIGSTTGENSMFGVNSSREKLPDDDELQLAVGRIYLFASYFHEWFFPNLRSRLVVFDMPTPEVSKRELEVLALSARGHSSKRIRSEARPARTRCSA